MCDKGLLPVDEATIIASAASAVSLANQTMLVTTSSLVQEAQDQSRLRHLLASHHTTIHTHLADLEDIGTSSWATEHET